MGATTLGGVLTNSVVMSGNDAALKAEDTSRCSQVY